MPSEIPVVSPPLLEIFVRTHRQKIIIASLLIMSLTLLFGGLFFWKRSEHCTAERLLSQASGIEGWKTIIHRYPRSGAAANALLLLAGAQAQHHHFEESKKTYTQFLKYFSHYPIAISAYIGMAMNEDASGNSEQALRDLQQAVVAYPKSYGAPEALLFQARIMTRLGKNEEAARLLQFIMNQYPESLVSTIVLRKREETPK